MQTLQQADLAMFRLINQEWVHPILDRLMPFISSVPFSVVFGLALAAVVFARHRERVIAFVGLLLVLYLVGDKLIVGTLKKTIGRSRPYEKVADTRLIVKELENRSMPSGHASSWFAVATLTFLYYRRSIFVMLPMAAAVAYSRMYNGVHYPTDVAVGSILGIGYALGLIGLCHSLWNNWGPRWLPRLWNRFPRLWPPLIQ